MLISTHCPSCPYFNSYFEDCDLLYHEDCPYYMDEPLYP